MARLEDITRVAALRGILPDAIVTAVDVKWIGTVAIELTYKDSAGRLGNELIYRDREPTIEVVTVGKPWSFDGTERCSGWSQRPTGFACPLISSVV